MLSHKNLEPGRQVQLSSLRPISKQPLNLLTKAIFHPPPKTFHKELKSLWVQAIALPAGLNLGDGFCFELTGVIRRYAQGASCKPHKSCGVWKCVSSRNFLPASGGDGARTSTELLLLDVLPACPGCCDYVFNGVSQKFIHLLLYLKLKGIWLGGWELESQQWAERSGKTGCRIGCNVIDGICRSGVLLKKNMTCLHGSLAEYMASLSALSNSPCVPIPS